MTTSFENQTIEELKRKRHQLCHYISKIDKELERRNAKLTVSERIDAELDELEVTNTGPVRRIVKKVQTFTRPKPKPKPKPSPQKTVKVKEEDEVTVKKKKKLTKAIIKKALDTKKIKYKSSASKGDLEDLMRKYNLVRVAESFA